MSFVFIIWNSITFQFTKKDKNLSLSLKERDYKTDFYFSLDISTGESSWKADYAHSETLNLNPDRGILFL